MPNVTIVGRPNVGKSALFNRLIGRKSAIVHGQPGITRDRISAICKRASEPFTLWDTGGIGGAGETELLSQVRRAADSAVRESDILLFLVDAQQGLSPIDEDLARLMRKSRKPVILVINKIDHPNHEDFATDFDSLGFKTSVSISAAHGRGTAELLETIDELLAQAGAASVVASDSRQSEMPLPQGLRPLQIAVVGRPNVGKSSIINAIIRAERAIVSELPGTTRDSIDISFHRDGDDFVFIDTAGIRRRGKQSSSVEVFSVMRSEKSIRRADLCVLTVDITSGVTAQDKKIAGLIQDARKACIILVNKLDLVQKGRSPPRRINELANDARQRLFFLDYAPVLVTSALTGEHVDKLFRLVEKIKRAAQTRIGTGLLNRLLRAAFAANPPPMVSGRRLKLFYATHKRDPADARPVPPSEFVLFVNEPRLLGQTYRRYLEAQIRARWPYTGLPVLLTLRPRSAGT